MNNSGVENDNMVLATQTPTQTQPYRFTSDEMHVLKECNRESFYQRCLPMGAVLGTAAYFGVQAGYLKPSGKLGAAPKVIVGVVVGYFLGKFSYQGKCAEKLMQLPNSQIGEMLRQRRRGGIRETLDPGFGAGMSLAPFSSMSSNETYTDVGPNNTLDLDTSRPAMEGLDDSHRPSLDNPVFEEDMPPVQKHTTSYDELRKLNREEFQQRKTGNYKNAPDVAPYATDVPLLGSATPASEPGERRQTNKYGDTWS